MELEVEIKARTVTYGTQKLKHKYKDIVIQLVDLNTNIILHNTYAHSQRYTFVQTQNNVLSLPFVQITSGEGNKQQLIQNMNVRTTFLDSLYDVVVVVSHIQRIGCQPEKNYFTRWPIPLVVC